MSYPFVRQGRGRALIAKCFLGLGLSLAGVATWAQYDEIHLRTLQCTLGTAEVHPSDLRVLVADGTYLMLEETANAFRSTADGSRFLALIAGRGTEDFLVLRMTPTGRIEWAASAGGQRRERPLAIAVTTEGSVVSVGFTKSFFRSTFAMYLGTDDPHGFAMALTGDGERKWAQDFRLGGVTRELYLTAASPTRDGGVILGGLFHERAHAGGVLARVNADGAVVWTRVYGRGSGYAITDVIPGREGRHIVVAHTKSDSAVLIAEIDEDGTIGRASAIPLPGSDAPARAMAAPDGGVVLTSRTSDRKMVYATHFAADGKPTWSRAYMMDERPNLSAGAGAGDRGYLLVGTSRDSEARGEFFALRIGVDGAPLGASVVALRPYFASSEPRETVGVSNLFAVQPAPNGGFALAGSLLVGAQEDIDAIGAGRKSDLSGIRTAVMQMDLDTAGNAGACSKQVERIQRIHSGPGTAGLRAGERAGGRVRFPYQLGPARRPLELQTPEGGALRSRCGLRHRSCAHAPAGPTPRPCANSRNHSIDPGFAIESRFADFSGGCSSRIF